MTFSKASPAGLLLCYHLSNFLFSGRGGLQLKQYSLVKGFAKQFAMRRDDFCFER